MTFIKNNSYIVLIFVLSIGFAIIGVNKHDNDPSYPAITVNDGDTLWELAQHHADDMPSERWIEEVVKLNNLSTVKIKKGEDLRLPIRKTVKVGKVATEMAGDGK
ncbi:hypothetical protein FITA111629_01885 [Filibacter tadaridae]|uniref:Cell division suppressor protein YneA n=1 Tax=Filibacter tadaridae TaxID=2483811 RepID=A0A3P5XFN4_9BACL|nr:hypothetical protein [Filibacter tadaridae]VDC29668.1 Cell division suppressor protein YneA [Filibacter tadaridae]